MLTCIEWLVLPAYAADRIAEKVARLQMSPARLLEIGEMIYNAPGENTSKPLMTAARRVACSRQRPTLASRATPCNASAVHASLDVAASRGHAPPKLPASDVWGSEHQERRTPGRLDGVVVCIAASLEVAARHT